MTRVASRGKLKHWKVLPVKNCWCWLKWIVIYKDEQMMTAIDPNYFADMIRAEINQLNMLSETTKDSRAPVALDQQSVGRLSRMDAMQRQSMEIATEERRQRRLKALSVALRQIEAGDFGYCLKCDEEIAVGRLTVDPAVTVCIECA